MTGESKNSVRRTLQAALFADVVGYSRMMGEDELATLKAVRENIGIFQTHCNEHEGTIEQIRGDGVFAIFDSAVNAVQCAIDAQHAINSMNENIERPIKFRVGINLGEVLRDDTGLHGDSLNIASRLESMAEPGTVCVSSAVYEQIRNKLAFGYECLGEQRLKNISEPITAFCVHREVDGVTMAASPRVATAQQKVSLATKPSVVVLPFKDRSGNPDEGWFADGITEDITSNLSKFHNLFVIARNSAFLYKDRDIRPQQVAKELGVRYVAQGTIRKAGNRTRISVELADAETEHMIWAERYDRNLDDIFEVQDEIANTVVAATAVQIEASEAGRSSLIPPSDMAAYDLVLQGQQYVLKYRRPDNHEARRLYQAAYDVDSRYARANAAISRTMNIDWRYAWCEDQATALDQALEYAQNAIALDQVDARGFGELGFAHLYRKEHDAALDAYDRARKLNPNDADLMSDMADALCHAGRSEEGVELLKKAMQLNPFYPDQYLWHLGGAYYNLKQYEEAIAALQKMHNPAEGRRLLAASCGQLGRIEEAKYHAEKVLEAHPSFSLKAWADVQPDKFQKDVDHFVEGLEKAGLH